MKAIHIISSYAVDTIAARPGRKAHKRTGGPALWYQRYFRTQPVRFVISHGRKPGVAQITLRQGHERGTLVKKPSVISLKRMQYADAFVVSTLADEFDLASLVTLQGLRCVDVQGYVREAKGRGLKHMRISDGIAKSFDIVKMTAHEKKWISAKTLRIFKQKILLVTQSAKPTIVFEHRRRFAVKPRPVEAADTLGAGDTFFAAFVVAYVRKPNARKAVDIAMRATEKFLKGKW